jgi:isoquinoline 1-oxidoreductase beta subunit
VIAEKIGDAAEQLASGATFAANYELPLLAHTAMEPMNATVHVHDGRCEIWVGTQVPGKVQAGAAELLRIEPARVVVNNQYIGGGFGRRLEPDGPLKAVRIAQQVRGPVKVVWTREEDIRQSYYRPMYHDRLRAQIANGRIAAWQHRVTGPSILARWLPPAFRNGIDVDATHGAVEQPYDFRTRLIEYIRHETPVPAGFWRGVGPNSSVFSVECFLDSIAQQTRVDPVAFRRSMLTKAPRLRRVLDVAANKAGWDTPPEAIAGKRVGRGVALLQCFGSFLACVADVAIADDGDVDVTHVCVAADVGTVINPMTVEAQVQGGVVFGIGTVLHNEITIAKGRVQQSNFHDYRLLRIHEMPTIEVHLLPSTEPPGGIGEPGTVVVQPAISNAIFAATGTQLTRMPIDRARIARRASK